MSKYQITKTPAVDTRQGTVPEKEELIEYTQAHIRDVIGLFTYYMRREVYPDVKSHDYTKLEKIDLFHDNMKATLQKGNKFKTLKWWNIHVRNEPHHALDYTGSKKILIGHILHMLCDHVAAAKARSKTSKIEFQPMDDEKLAKVLVAAYYDTRDWLVSNSSVIEDKTVLPRVDGKAPLIGERTDKSQDTSTDTRLDEESDPENGSFEDS